MMGDRLVIQDIHIRAAAEIARLLLPRLTHCHGRLIITIAGESGSGKSEMAVALSRALSESGMDSLVIQQDDYFVCPPAANAKRRREDIGRVGLSEVSLALLDEQLRAMSAGEGRIDKPLVVFDQDLITEETVELNGAKAIIVDGTYTTLLDSADVRIFIDRTYVDTMEARRRRAREEQDSLLERILEIEHHIISPHRRQADIVVTRDFDIHVVGIRPEDMVTSALAP